MPSVTWYGQAVLLDVGILISFCAEESKYIKGMRPAFSATMIAIKVKFGIFLLS